MKLQDILQKSHILIDMKAVDKVDLITQMGRYLASCHNLPNPEFVVQKILERESDMSTGIGFGIAIPHTRIDGLPRSCMIAARTAADIEYDAIDENPVRLVFMLITPSNTATEHTALLTAISKTMAIEANRTALMGAATAGDFLDAIISGENALEQH